MALRGEEEQVTLFLLFSLKTSSMITTTMITNTAYRDHCESFLFPYNRHLEMITPAKDNCYVILITRFFRSMSNFIIIDSKLMKIYT